MKRLRPADLAGWIVALLSAAAVLAHRATARALLQDSDTAVLLATIRERRAPLSWFFGDWPLFNHFYRPVPTLAFELDDRLYGDAAWGYGLTNALLCAACVVALYALLRRLVPPLAAGAGAVLFALWTLDGPGVPDLLLWPLAALPVAFALARRSGLAYALLVALGVLALGREIGGIELLDARTVAWLPGRTATTCALFAFLALGGYAASVIAGAEPRPPREPLPTDPPATRSSVLPRPEPRPALARALFGLSLLATWLSLSSYEQGVMVPTLVFGVGLLLSPRYRVRFGAQVLHWGLLVGYLVLRAAVIPVAPSGYQRQVVRTGPGVWLALMDYLSPSLGGGVQAANALSAGPETLLLPGPWFGLLGVVSVLALWSVVERPARRSMAIWLGMSLAAFLPMAFLKHFEHYHYLPMALRTGFVLSAAGGLVAAFRRAASPRSLSAPPRSSPAPGSLPHL